MTTDIDDKAHDQIRILLNGEGFVPGKKVLTGAELVASANLPATNQLFLEVDGSADDRPIGANEEIHLHSGMKFYDVPVGTFG